MTEVDPRNRLVAGELERRWNIKLDQLEAVNTTLNELRQALPPLRDHERETILSLGQRFEQVWSSENCPIELKKAILRTIVEEIVANVEEDGRTLHLVLHWKGGVHTEITMNKPIAATGLRTALEDLEIIRKMAVRYGDDGGPRMHAIIGPSRLLS